MSFLINKIKKKYIKPDKMEAIVLMIVFILSGFLLVGKDYVSEIRREKRWQIPFMKNYADVRTKASNLNIEEYY